MQLSLKRSLIILELGSQLVIFPGFELSGRFGGISI